MFSLFLLIKIFVFDVKLTAAGELTLI